MWFRPKLPEAKLECITLEEQWLAFAHLELNGWVFSNPYNDFDAWIDYWLGAFVRGEQKIMYEWDNSYLEGTFTGEPSIILEIARVIGRNETLSGER
jgi:hypothetical protein